ncbi:MAG: hypothetical protein EAX86_10530 [Candidatus Heimdallarchaeota archaeon]|nr:hypothetical protein [Candidatus Heimdallarchaeota archaeon]
MFFEKKAQFQTVEPSMYLIYIIQLTSIALDSKLFKIIHVLRLVDGTRLMIFQIRKFVLEIQRERLR